VIECGVWKGETIAGMAEVLGADREYFLFDSFQGHLDPQPIDGPAALAWKEDKGGPWYFDNAVVGTEGAMLSSGAKSFKRRNAAEAGQGSGRASILNRTGAKAKLSEAKRRAL
jgi:hypothetical protein